MLNAFRGHDDVEKKKKQNEYLGDAAVAKSCLGYKSFSVVSWHVFWYMYRIPKLFGKLEDITLPASVVVSSNKSK